MEKSKRKILKSENNQKDKILEYCQEKFIRDGFAKISMDSIAKDLHISKKTIYLYFDTKEKLVEEVIFKNLSFMTSRIDTIINSNENAIEKLINIFMLFTGFISKIGDNWIRDLRIHYSHLWEKIDDFRTKKLEWVFGKILQQGIEEKLIRDVPPEILLNVIVSSIRSIANPEFLFKYNFSFNRAVFYIFDIILNGILTKKGKLISSNLFKRLKDESI